MADQIIGNTQLAASKEALIASVVQKELKFQAKLLSTVTDVSAFAQPGFKSISFPKMGSFTVAERASGAAGDAQQIAVTVDTLDLNVPAYVAWLVDMNDALQSKLSVQAELARRAASGHGRYVDTKTLAELASVASLSQQGAAPAAIAEDDVLDMREHLLKSFSDLSRAFLVVGPSQEKNLLKITRFSSQDVYGREVIPTGFLGIIHGVSVVVHAGITDTQAYMYDSEGLAIGFQAAPQMSDQLANEYGSQSRRYAMDQLFGVKGMQLGENGAAAGKSPLVAKLHD